MDAIGLRIVFKVAKWPEQLKAARAGKLMMWGVGWSAGSPDGDTFLALGYGPNKGQANHARFDLAAFNALYEKQGGLPDGPERQAAMDEAKKLMIAYMPYKVHVHRDLDRPVAPVGQGLPPQHLRARVLEVRGPGPGRAAAPRFAMKARLAALAVMAVGACGHSRRFSARRRTAAEGAAHVLPHRRDRLRPGEDHRPVFAHRHAAHLRRHVRLRPSGTAAEDRADHRRGHARALEGFPRSGRCVSNRASISPTTRPSRASSASWWPRTMSMLSSALPIRPTRAPCGATWKSSTSSA